MTTDIALDLVTDARWTIDDARRLADEARDCGAHPRVHPNGFIQLDLIHPDDAGVEATSAEWNETKKRGHSGSRLRLHIWNPPGFDLPHQETVNEIHDHVFDMLSSVVRGTLVQQLYILEVGMPVEARTHEIYRAVYDKTSSSRLEPLGVYGYLSRARNFPIKEGEAYSQQAFTLHDSEAYGVVVTLMEKLAVHDGDATVVCKVGQPPDNDFDRVTAAPPDLLWSAIEAALA
jgi:hypothetical protein